MCRDDLSSALGRPDFLPESFCTLSAFNTDCDKLRIGSPGSKTIGERFGDGKDAPENSIRHVVFYRFQVLFVLCGAEEQIGAYISHSL